MRAPRPQQPLACTFLTTNGAVCPRREALSAKLRPDARGYFPWENFFEIFKQGQEDEQLHNVEQMSAPALGLVQ